MMPTKKCWVRKSPVSSVATAWSVTAEASEFCDVELATLGVGLGGRDGATGKVTGRLRAIKCSCAQTMRMKSSLRRRRPHTS